MAMRNPGRFFGCYLLCSLNPQSKNRTYIGFTVNPKRRIRQHNGEITSGARFTKKMRPWEMVLCVHGFPSQVHALQFEWAWQHPKKSKAVKEAAAKLKNITGVKGKMKLLFTMLSLLEWSSMKLTVQFFSTEYVHLRKGFQALPEHMQVVIAPLDDLPTYENSLDEEPEEEAEMDSDTESSMIHPVPLPVLDVTKPKVRRGRVKATKETSEAPARTKKTSTLVSLGHDGEPVRSFSPYRDVVPQPSRSPSPGLSRPALTPLEPYHGNTSPYRFSPLSPCFPSSPLVLRALRLSDDRSPEKKKKMVPPIIILSPTPLPVRTRARTLEIIDLSD